MSTDAETDFVAIPGENWDLLHHDGRQGNIHSLKQGTEKGFSFTIDPTEPFLLYELDYSQCDTHSVIFIKGYRPDHSSTLLRVMHCASGQMLAAFDYPGYETFKYLLDARLSFDLYNRKTILHVKKQMMFPDYHKNRRPTEDLFYAHFPLIGANCSHDLPLSVSNLLPIDDKTPPDIAEESEAIWGTRNTKLMTKLDYFDKANSIGMVDHWRTESHRHGEYLRLATKGRRFTPALQTKIPWPERPDFYTLSHKYIISDKWIVIASLSVHGHARSVIHIHRV